jgi:hypothetical protein
MAGETSPNNPELNTTLAPATNFFSLGADLLGEVQRIIGTDRVRALRVKLGNRVVKEIPVAPLTAVATVALVLLAVVVSTMSIEVEHEPAGAGAASEA